MISGETELGRFSYQNCPLTGALCQRASLLRGSRWKEGIPGNSLDLHRIPRQLNGRFPASRGWSRNGIPGGLAPEVQRNFPGTKPWLILEKSYNPIPADVCSLIDFSQIFFLHLAGKEQTLGSTETIFGHNYPREHTPLTISFILRFNNRILE